MFFSYLFERLRYATSPGMTRAAPVCCATLRNRLPSCPRGRLPDPLFCLAAFGVLLAKNGCCCLICDPGHQLSPVRFPAYMLRKRVAVSMSASAGLPIFSRTLKEPSVVAEDEAVRSGEWPMCRPARSQACSVVDGVESNVSACGRLNLERWLLAGRCCRTMACVACVLTPIATPPS